MYINKCTKCGAEFETKNPKRVICPNCLYPERKAVPTEATEKELPEREHHTSYSAGEDEQRENRNGYDRPQRTYDNRGGYGDRPQRTYDNRGGYGDRPQRTYDNRGGYGDRPQRTYDNRGGYGDRPQRNYDNRGGYGDRPQRTYDNRGGYGDRPQRTYDNRGGYGDRPQRNYDNRGGYGDRPQRNYDNNRRPGNFNRRPGGFNKRPQRPKQLLISREQLEQIEIIYKKALPLPNHDIHEVIGTVLEIEARKVFFGINLVRQKMMLPKLPFPKRKLAVTPDQLTAIKTLYEPLLPLPPIGCHKIISAQLKMDEWRVHVGIGLVRKQMGLDRWNPDRPDAPAEFKNQKV